MTLENINSDCKSDRNSSSELITDLKVYLVVAPSGSGKSTLIFNLLKNHSDIIELSVSYTTRSPRSNEQHGIHYNFCSKEHFKNLIKNNKLLEWAKVHDCYYGTSIDEIIEINQKGKKVLLEIDIQGLLQVKKALSGIQSMFILPPSFDEMKTRLASRNTESHTKRCTRFQSALNELKLADHCNFFLINDDIKIAQKIFNNWLVNELDPEFNNINHKEIRQTVDEMIKHLGKYCTEYC